MVSRTALEPLFSTQKKCLRMMFGDNDAYADKFRTCARTRIFGTQVLGPQFYKLEDVEPLFVKEKILSVFSLYKYYSVFEMYKIIKLRDPYSMYCSTLHLGSYMENYFCDIEGRLAQGFETHR